MFISYICPLTNEEAVFQPSAGAALGYINTQTKEHCFKTKEINPDCKLNLNTHT